MTFCNSIETSPFNILDPDYVILGHHFLEASAGTGKTFTIEHLVVRLLLQEEMMIDQILVVTFTRAATRELKIRIRSNLEKALEGLCRGDGFDYLMPYIKQGSKIPLRKIERALACFDQAHIFTIHGFCHRMLTEFAFDAGLSFGVNDLSEKAYKGLLREEVRDFFRTALKEDNYSVNQLDIVLKKYGYDVDRLAEALIRLIEEGCKIALQSNFKEERDPSKILLQMAYECQQKWDKQLFREALSPDEILKKMESCLKNTAFASQVANKYQAAIIDEFQDTDPIQWHIFEQLFLNESSLKAFYVVGDPKQSIYGFRSADIYTYLQAEQSMGGKSFLNVNFRAEPPLVNALNAFFLSAPWLELPSLEQNLPFYPVKSYRPTSVQDMEGSLHFFLVNAIATREKKWPSLSLEEDYLFPFIAIECEKYPHNTKAVLVKDRYQSKRLHLYLKKYQIPCSIKGGEDLKKTSEFISLEAICAAGTFPGDLSRVKEALSTGLIGWGSEDFLNDKKLQYAKLLFQELHLVLKERGFIIFFQKVIEAFSIEINVRMRRLIESILSSSLDPLLFFQEVKKSEEVFDLIENCQANDITIMTTHMSKGLEFDLVFALGLASRHGIKEEFIRSKRHLLPFDSEDPACQLAIRESEAEKLRQLYVALTRAKKQVYLPIIIDPHPKTSFFSPIELFLQKAIGTSLERQNIEAFIERLSEKYSVTSTWLYEKREPSQRPLFLSPTPVSIQPLPIIPKEEIFSFSSLSQHRATGGAEPLLNELPIGSETGILIHKILEKIFQNRWHSPYQKEKCKQLIQKEIMGTCLEEGKEALFEMIEKALHHCLIDFALVDISPKHMMQEMEFIFPLNTRWIKGVIDLSFEWRGKYYFLDWKSNWLKDYSQASLKASMHENDYFLQASLYAEALKRYVKLFDNGLEFGGAFYYFLRGATFYHFFPEREYAQ